MVLGCFVGLGSAALRKYRLGPAKFGDFSRRSRGIEKGPRVEGLLLEDLGFHFGAKKSHLF
jgi:hypothetical protein